MKRFIITVSAAVTLLLASAAAEARGFRGGGFHGGGFRGGGFHGGGFRGGGVAGFRGGHYGRHAYHGGVGPLRRSIRISRGPMAVTVALDTAPTAIGIVPATG